MSSGYNESGLGEGTQDIHRALASFQEELEAIDYYQQRMDKTSDPELRALLEHNRDEEIEHATMLFEWLRRTMPGFDAQAKQFIFSKGSITAQEEGSSDDAPDAAASGRDGAGLGIGNLTS